MKKMDQMRQRLAKLMLAAMLAMVYQQLKHSFLSFQLFPKSQICAKKVANCTHRPDWLPRTGGRVGGKGKGGPWLSTGLSRLVVLVSMTAALTATATDCNCSQTTPDLPSAKNESDANLQPGTGLAAKLHFCMAGLIEPTFSRDVAVNGVLTLTTDSGCIVHL